MKLISYHATRPGFQALGSISVRSGTNSIFSHTEIMFEPGDDVDDLMPDKTTIPKEDGSLWCASSTATDVMPEWSKRRAGHKGGIRFKRIVVGNHWSVQDITKVRDPREVALAILDVEGLAYDWRHILGFMGPVFNLIFNQSVRKFTCTEVCAMALGFPQAYRFHPGNLPPAIERIISENPAQAQASYDELLRLARNAKDLS